MGKNPFLDLGLPPEEAAALHIRSRLATELEQYIERKGWSQAEAAKAFKVPQPTISKIMNGKIDKLSIEFLVKMFVRIGVPVDVTAGRKRAKARGTDGARASAS